jgi:putative ABC transport system ATP-binding protein
MATHNKDMTMDKSIFRFIWRYSKREQIIVLFITLASFPFLYLSLEIPKIIINEALTGTDFPKQIFAVDLSQMAYLLTLCFAFLLLVLTNGVFKMRINIYKGTIAERMMRRLRYQLVNLIMRFPPDHFKRVSQGDLIPMVTAEVEPLGGLFGDAVASPVFLGGQMLTIMLFLFVQNVLLGIAAVALIPLQAYVIPMLQRKVNLLNREKVKQIRSLSNYIGETVSGVGDIHVNDTSAYAMSNYSKRLGIIYKIRLDVYNKKFFMKFLNNLINQITPFFFYSIGGYLVITGSLSVGALVAALGACKDLTSPWRDLLTFYNQVQDSSIRYEAIVEQFSPEGMKPVSSEYPDTIGNLSGSIEVANVSWQDQDGIRALQNVSFTLPAGSRTAFIGPDDLGRNRLAQLLSRSVDPVAGRISVGGQSFSSLSEAVVGARIAYVGPDNYLFNGTVEDNVKFGLNRKPPLIADLTPSQMHDIEEARATGNSPYPYNKSWVDYATAGYANHEDFLAWWLRILDTIDAGEQVYALGLRGRLDIGQHPAIAARILKVRTRMGQNLASPAFENLIFRFDPAFYNPCSTVAENILFGTAVDDRLATDNLCSHPFMIAVLDACQLRETFEQLSLTLASQIVEMFSNVSPGHPYFERFGFVDEEQLPRLKLIHARAERDIGKLADEDRNLLLSLPFRLIPERHRLGLIDEPLQARILEARHWFAEHIPESLEDAVTRFDPQQYHPGLSIFDNVVFGRISFSKQDAEAKAQDLVLDLVDQAGLRDDIILLIDKVQVGSGGSLLPISGRERIALARALAKRPDILICNQALASFPAEERRRIYRNLHDLLPSTTLIWIDRELLGTDDFDAVFEVKGGRVLPPVSTK